MKKFMIPFLFLFLLALVAYAGMELTSARVYRKQGDLQKALEWYDRAIEADSASVVAHYEKGELLGQMAEDQQKPEYFVGMRKEFDAVLNLATRDPKQVKKYQSKMDEQLDKYWMIQYNEAVEKYRVADKDSLLDAAAKARVKGTWGTLEKAQRDSLMNVVKSDSLKKAEEILNVANTIDPERWRSYALMQSVQIKKGDRDAAEANLREAVAHHRKPSELTSKKYAIKETEEQWKQSQLEMLEALAQISFDLKKYKETIETCNEIFGMDSLDIVATKFTAVSYNMLGEREKAIDAYKKAIAAMPDNTGLLYDAAQLYLQAGDTTQAEKCLTDLVAIDPKDFEVVFLLGVIYLEGGSFADNNKAKELFGNAIKNFPENSAIWQNYGVALIRGGEIEEGKKALAKAKELKGE